MAPVPEDVDVDMAHEDGDDDQEQRLINEEYKTWKKNSPFLYDMILGTALSWPTLTTQWFPDVKEIEDKNYRVHRLLLGTHTAEGSPNYLQIAEVQIPKLGAPNANDYDEERGEIGGYGKGHIGGESLAIKFNIVQKIEHPTEVNKARYQPQNPHIIATCCSDGRILIFDKTMHPNSPSTPGKINPQIELVGHNEEGFGLAWNPHEEGKLASASDCVCLWDLKNDYKDKSAKVSPSRKYTHHAQIVNDVQYHPVHKSLIGTVSDDLTLQIIDVRQPTYNKASVVARNGHVEAINTLAFSPNAEVLIATGSADKTIALWDLRNTKNKVHTLEGHSDAVTSVSWHPQEPAILGSGSYDRRVIFWDLARIGEEQQPDDQDDGPPELLFMHGGHKNNLTEFSWNLNDPWVVCSAAEDNLLQIWKVADTIVGFEDADIRMEELDR